MAVQAGQATNSRPTIVVVERINTGDTELRITAAVANPEQVTEAEAKLALGPLRRHPRPRPSTSSCRSATAHRPRRSAATA